MLDELYHDGDSGWTVITWEPDNLGKEIRVTEFAAGIDEDALDVKKTYECDADVTRGDFYAGTDDECVVKSVGEVISEQEDK